MSAICTILALPEAVKFGARVGRSSAVNYCMDALHTELNNCATKIYYMEALHSTRRLAP